MEGFGRILEEERIHAASIRTSFMRPEAPLLIDTADLLQWK